MTSTFFDIVNEITGNESSQNCRKSVLERIYTELIQTPENHLLSKSLLIVNMIELLSQFHSGKLYKKGNHKRFDRFLRACGHADPDMNYRLYVFRNALVHNGGSYASDQKGNIYRFQLIQDGKLIHEVSRVVYAVNIDLLQSFLEQILVNLGERLKSDSDLRNRFVSVHKRIGTTIN